MAIHHELRLHEEILLLALHDEKGTIQGGMSSIAIGGAILGELLLGGRVVVEKAGKRGLVSLRDTRQVGDRIVDESLERVRIAKRRAAPATWVSRFGATKRLRHRIAEGLVYRGVLRAHEGKVLLVFPRTTYPTSNPRPEQAVIERLRGAIFSDGDGVDPRTAVLASIAHAAGLLNPVFGKKEIKGRKTRIEELGTSSTAEATDDAVEATQAAIAATQAAMIAAVTAATVAASG